MLRPITTSSASASNAPTAVHASAAANLSAHQPQAAAVGTSDSPQAYAASGNAEQLFRYNSYEFIYRQDIGRIVLIGQSPETGERVVQVPSEQALRAYEQTKRAERQVLVQTGEPPAQHTTTAVSTAPKPELAKALVAAVGGENHGSAVVSISA